MSRLNDTKAMSAILRHLEQRTAKLVALVETASQANGDKRVRDQGAQLAERIAEMMQDLQELAQADDDGFMEAADVYHRRLYLAEQKVETWNIPASVKKRLDKKPKEAAAPRRRRAPRKKAA